MNLDRTRRALCDGLLIILLGPLHHGEKPKILPETRKKTQKTLVRFAQKVNQSRPTVEPDRTGRALSDGLLIFFFRPFLHGEKPDILPQP
jgi:hypothetical protein